MFELDKKYKRGKKTLIFLFVVYGWWLTAIGILFIYGSWSILFGPARDATEKFLLSHPDWYITGGMLAEWSVLVGISFIIVAYLRAHVLHRYYKFMIDKHAFHLHRGWFSIRETTIPYHHISNVHIIRPYVYRLFGIVKLDVVTTSDREIERSEDPNKKFLIPVIDKTVARSLSKFLLENASKSRRGRLRNEYEDLEEDDDEEYEDDADDTDENNDTDEDVDETDDSDEVLVVGEK